MQVVKKKFWAMEEAEAAAARKAKRKEEKRRARKEAKRNREHQIEAEVEHIADAIMPVAMAIDDDPVPNDYQPTFPTDQSELADDEPISQAAIRDVFSALHSMCVSEINALQKFRKTLEVYATKNSNPPVGVINKTKKVNAYIYFRKHLQAGNPSAKLRVSDVAALWKQLTAEEKEKYRILATEASTFENLYHNPNPDAPSPDRRELPPAPEV